MRQVLLSVTGAFLARVPRPVAGPGEIVVKTEYSALSVGTETAGLTSGQVSSDEGSVWLERARIAQSYAGKAIRNPRLAVKRSMLIARRQARKFFPTKAHHQPDLSDGSTSKPSRTERDDQGWNVGYSVVGTVVEVGAGVRDITLGQRVACTGAGLANHAEFVRVPRNLAAIVPSGCSPIAASSVALGAIALQAVRRANVGLQDVVAIVGLGLLGQIATQFLLAAGCKVVGFDPVDERVQRALQAGMTEGAADESQLKSKIDTLTGGHGVDCCILAAATPSNDPINLAMSITRRRGRVVILGDVGLGVARQDFYKKEIDLLMSTSLGPGRYDRSYEVDGHDYPLGYVRWTMNRNMSAYLAMIADGRLDIDAMIDRTADVSEAPQIYQDIVQGDERPLLVIMSYGEASNDDEAVPARVTIGGHRNDAKTRAQSALIGAGAFGVSTLVPLIEKHKGAFFLSGVVSQDAVRGGNFARDLGLKYLASDISAVIDDAEIGMVFIATRHNLHAHQVVSALDAGKHVFVEKPLATTWEQLDEVAESYARSNGALLMVGFNRRFSPAVRALKNELKKKSGPFVAHYRVNAGYIPPDHWVQTEEGGGRNIGEACHMYDVLRFLADAPVLSVGASSIVPDSPHRLVNDNFNATLVFENGSLGTVTYSSLGPKSGLGKERLELFCDGEAYVLDNFETLTRSRDSAILYAGAPDKGHAAEFEALAAAVEAGGPAPIVAEEIFEVSAVALEIEDILTGRGED